MTDTILCNNFRMESVTNSVDQRCSVNIYSVTNTLRLETILKITLQKFSQYIKTSFKHEESKAERRLGQNIHA
jgi:hypothetical protein